MSAEHTQDEINSIADQFAEHQGATSFYLRAKGEDAGPLAFSTHFNPRLGVQSNYFSKLHSLMSCVEANAHKSDATVCAKEFKAVRLSAFKDELLYHQVNQRHFMNENMHKRNESPY